MHRPHRPDQRRQQLRALNNTATILLHAQRHRGHRRDTDVTASAQPAQRRCSGSPRRWPAAGASPVGARLPDDSQPERPPPLTSTWSPQLQQPGPRGLLLDISESSTASPATPPTTTYNSFDPYPPPGHAAGRGRRPRLPRPRRGLPPARRADAAVRDPGRHQRHRPHPPVGRHRPTARPRPGRPTSGAASSTYSYFRPPGLPGTGDHPPAEHHRTRCHFPWTSGEVYPTTIVTNVTPATPRHDNPLSNNNPLHGFEAQRFPNLEYGGYLRIPSASAARRST